VLRPDAVRKTLAARLYAISSLTGRNPLSRHAPPPGGIIVLSRAHRDGRFFPHRRAGGAVRHHIGIADPRHHCRPATPALQHFFDVRTEIDFLAERTGRLLVCILYITDRTAASLRRQRDIKSFGRACICSQRCNEGAGLLTDRERDELCLFRAVPRERAGRARRSSPDVIEAVEQPVFSFARVVEGRQGRLSESELLRLLSFLNQVLPRSASSSSASISQTSGVSALSTGLSH
jgi:hypothetical protein